MPADAAPPPTYSSVSAAYPVSSASSRRAASSSVSVFRPSPASPAGSSITRASTGGRYCSTSTSFPSSVTGTSAMTPLTPLRLAYSHEPARMNRMCLPSATITGRSPVAMVDRLPNGGAACTSGARPRRRFALEPLPAAPGSSADTSNRAGEGGLPSDEAAKPLYLAPDI
jgi:hypothetical protein